MAPVPVSAGLARALVGAACLAWDVPHLYYPARTVVSGLADDAIERAAGDFEVTAAKVGRYLRIGVQAHSLVAGTTRLGDDAIVWALLRVDSMAGMSVVPGGFGVFRTGPERLTEREVIVVRFLATKLTVGEIAAELDLSVHTVKAYMKSIYRKLDASRRREAVDRARTRCDRPDHAGNRIPRG
jgi:DNA-binding CsgD family transcriptional regulator